MLRLWLTALLLGREAYWKNTYLLKVATKYVFIFIFGRGVVAAAAAAACCCCCPQHQYWSGGNTFSFLVAALLLLFTHREGCAEKKKDWFLLSVWYGYAIKRVDCDWVRTAALSHSPRFLLTLVLKQREVPATVSSFYVSVLYTAMLRTSITAVVLGCFYFCL